METQTVGLNPTAIAGVYCGPAIVLDIAQSRLTLQLPGREARAEVALAYPYHPRVNDIVLALGAEDGDVYVVGVLQGSGSTRISVAGDLHVEASGRLRLRGGTGVDIDSDRVSVTARRYELAAGSVIERLDNVYRWVKDVIMTSAGRTRTVVEQKATLTAGRIVERSKHDVVIDGQQIRLG